MFPNPYRCGGDSSFPSSVSPTSPSSKNTTITPLFANAQLLDTGKAALGSRLASYYCLLYQSHPDSPSHSQIFHFHTYFVFQLATSPRFLFLPFMNRTRACLMSAVKGILEEATVHTDLKVQVHLFYLKPYEVRVL